MLKTKKKANIKFKVEINDSFKLFLKKNYQINGRFKLCDDFLTDFEICQKNFYNERDSHQIKENSFQIKISNGKTISVNTMKNNLKQSFRIQSNPFLTVKFWRYNVILLKETEKLFLSNF